MAETAIVSIGADIASSGVKGGDAAQMIERMTLDGLVGDTLKADQTNAELGNLGRQALTYGVSNPFLNGEINVKSAPEGGLIGDASRESVDMIGGTANAGGHFDDPKLNGLVDTMKEMYLESAKTLLAWNIVQQVSKDTKIMLQSQ